MVQMGCLKVNRVSIWIQIPLSSMPWFLLVVYIIIIGQLYNEWIQILEILADGQGISLVKHSVFRLVYWQIRFKWVIYNGERTAFCLIVNYIGLRIGKISAVKKKFKEIIRNAFKLESSSVVSRKEASIKSLVFLCDTTSLYGQISWKCCDIQGFWWNNLKTKKISVLLKNQILSQSQCVALKKHFILKLGFIMVVVR